MALKYMEFFFIWIMVIALLSIAAPWITVINVGLAYALGGLTMFLSQMRINQRESQINPPITSDEAH